jgi:hypothetical protein
MDPEPDFGSEKIRAGLEGFLVMMVRYTTLLSGIGHQ